MGKNRVKLEGEFVSVGRKKDLELFLSWQRWKKLLLVLQWRVEWSVVDRDESQKLLSLPLLSLDRSMALSVTEREAIFLFSSEYFILFAVKEEGKSFFFSSS